MYDLTVWHDETATGKEYIGRFILEHDAKLRGERYLADGAVHFEVAKGAQTIISMDRESFLVRRKAYAR